MPCWEEWAITSDFSQADSELVKKAIKDAGLENLVLFEDGKLIADKSAEGEKHIARVKRAYAKRITKQVAKKRGWRVEESKQDKRKLYIRR